MLIGICEDDPSIRRLVSQAMGFAGHEVLTAYDGGEALRRFGADSAVDVLIMDIGLPDSDGRDVTQALRSAGQSAPVLFLTALGTVQDKLSGFSAGGDDYLPKPFDVKELIARVEALAKRGRPAGAHDASGLVLDPARHGVRSAQGEVLLTPTEYRMLAAITSRPGDVVRRRTVVAAAWPDGAVVAENTIDSFVRRIRTKLDSIGSPVTIETVRGVGFRLT
ncbi:DNA-binding response regulator [Nocardioides psychrotolerans]|uniref:Two-component system, OmpR family, response regulator MprA n=1 Tax=Nocardioides psychrotolerans TaxID=1005945 RepID=A0A1I3PE24_9ACTN|nr:response regulator transcription factor [Nocardioides psychrotolerans]GEP39655.1 DNA-binding response regulator [Nocardioides psychrotolerans]SFJ19597.1 two-component system, OmpR family, response regulator MprA [Nocardioides psychrotolerans]